MIASLPLRRLSLVLAVCSLSLTHVLAKPPSTADVGAAMTKAAQGFLATLDKDQLAKATMAFDNPKRLDWHNIPKPERKGMQVRDMSSTQLAACNALLRSALSPAGFDKAQQIMALENNLREGEKNLKGGQLRDPLRYFLTIFGQPESTGDWGWSFEGHHFSLNFVIRDGQVVSSTPSFWGANPATVHVFIPGGPEKGIRTLGQEEQLAFDLVNSLDEGQRKKAIIADKAPAEYRAAGKPQPPHTAPEGIAASEMTQAQKDLLWSLLVAYNSNLAGELAAARLDEVQANDLNKVHFAWQGATKPGVGHYYRIQGPSFVLELVNIQSDPEGNVANHIHSVWRSLQGDFGVAAK